MSEDTLGDALPAEMARVRGIVVVYRQIPSGGIAATLMERDLDLAAKALAEQDVVAMIAVYQSLKEWQL